MKSEYGGKGLPQRDPWSSDSSGVLTGFREKALNGRKEGAQRKLQQEVLTKKLPSG